jgi:hypothetical protein
MPTIEFTSVALVAPRAHCACLPHVVSLGRQLVVGPFAVILLDCNDATRVDRLRLSSDALHAPVRVSDDGRLSVGAYTFTPQSPTIDESHIEDALVVAATVSTTPRVVRVGVNYYLAIIVGHALDGCSVIVTTSGEDMWRDIPRVRPACWSCVVDRGGWRCVNGRALVYAVSTSAPSAVRGLDSVSVHEGGRVSVAGSRVGMACELTDELARFVSENCARACTIGDAAGALVAVVLLRDDVRDWQVSDWCVDH